LVLSDEIPAALAELDERIKAAEVELSRLSERQFVLAEQARAASSEEELSRIKRENDELRTRLDRAHRHLGDLIEEFERGVNELD
jgi:uncharacterized coiled-coil DUF342 family protein